jgi:hypothetical protein
MTKNDFNCEISAEIGAGEAIQKISNVTGWWGVTFAGSAAKQGDRFTIKMGGDSFFDFTVVEVTPGKRVVWLITDCYMPWFSDKKEWANTQLIFDLNENEGLTDLRFTHEGLTPDVECYKDCSLGWTHWIKKSLYSYLTTGEGVFKKA